MAEDLKFFIQDKVHYFPVREILFYNIEATSEEVNEERIKTLEKLMGKKPCVIVASIEAILLKLSPSKLYNKYVMTFNLGDSINLQKVIETFIIQGYERTDRVEAKGQFSIRGGIIDIYTVSQEDPIRIELFNDEVDSIRSFRADTQKSIEKKQQAKIFPVIENIIESSHRKEIISKLDQDLATILKKLEKDPAQKLKDKVDQIKEKLEYLESSKGLYQILPYLYDEATSLMDYLSPEAIIIANEPERLRDRIRGYTEEFKENFKTLLERGEVLPKQGELLLNYGEIVKQWQKYKMVTLTLLPKNNPDLLPKAVIQFLSRPIQSFHGKINLFTTELRTLIQKDYRIILLASTKDKALGLMELLKDQGFSADFVVSDGEAIKPRQISILQGSIHRGFEYVDLKCAVITDYEIYGVHKKKKQIQKRKDAAPIKSFIDLQMGNYVVHEGHGIGKYVGIEELKVEGVKKDYLKIRYSGEDHLYVPTDQMDLIQKYIGGEDRAPKLNKLSGIEWVKTKAKVKKAIEDMAEELLKLYAQREKSKGYAFSPDTDWQKQFEYLFPYEETPDQLKSIEEVKKVMESERPMDCLLCGDVGYGKTEVAIRAAFKCVMDSKQVAFLVPTTILAQQHYNTFKRRFADFPINVEMLSRFKTAAQQKQIIEAVRTRNVDIIIGTHRILSKDVVYNDIGLLIIDEEQRFGVKHKEALKQLKKNIDVLSLTATPIPRTLHMAMTGIRDMSIIEDPPEERYPVQTYVVVYNESLVIDAILREIARGGQVYYVTNRVQGIHQVAAKLAKLIPKARIAVGHGQMKERELEKLMVDYYNGEYDVLVCTTIIETGLDIANVNTIIIQDADKFGLSQLYQLRGRVGRSNRQGYAYLMVEKDKMLSETAEKRLKAIKEFTEFGSGFKIAMRDLEIRGAGNILGSEQHGQMSSIGYDLYIKLLEETMGEIKGKTTEKLENPSIECNVDAYIPNQYISNQSHKIEIYKKIASIRNIEDLYGVEEEIEDRFGDIPFSVRNLLFISYIKALAKNIKVRAISQKENHIRIQFNDFSGLKPENIAQVLHVYKSKVTFHSTGQPYFIYKVTIKEHYKMLMELKDIIEKISGFQEGLH